MLVSALDAVGLNRAVVGLGDADLFRQLLDELEVEGDGARPDPRSPRGARSRRDRGRGRRPRRARRGRASPDRPALEPSRRRRRDRQGEGGRGRRRRARHQPACRDLRASRRAGDRRPRSARPRPAPRPRLLHGRDPRGLRPRRGPDHRRRRPLRRADGQLRPAASGSRVRALSGARPHRAGRRGATRAAGGWHRELGRRRDRRPAHGRGADAPRPAWWIAARGQPRPARSGRASTRPSCEETAAR